MVKKKAMPPDRPSREEEVKNEGCDRSGGTGLPWEREKGCSPFPTGAHAHHGLRDGERLTVSEGRKEAGPFPSDIPRARKPITVDNSQWKEQPWERAPKTNSGMGPVRHPNTSAAMSSNARFLWESSFAMRLSWKPVSKTSFRSGSNRTSPKHTDSR